VAIGSLSNVLGCLVGFALGSFWITNSDADDHAAGRKHVVTYLRFTSYMVTLMCLPIVFAYKEKP